MQIISRSEAKELGLKRYFTGKPCANGHLDEKHTSSGGCVTCTKLRAPALYAKHAEKRRSERVEHYKKNAAACREYSRQYRLKNHEAALEYDRKRYRENKAAELLRQSDWRKSNKDKVSLQSRRYYLKNKEKIISSVSIWREENPEKLRAISMARRSRKVSAEGSHSAADITAMLESQKHKCANCLCCLKESGYHVDHIQPLSKGGSNWPSNLQCLCPNCNLRKHAKDPIEWAQQNGRLI